MESSYIVSNCVDSSLLISESAIAGNEMQSFDNKQNVMKIVRIMMIHSVHVRTSDCLSLKPCAYKQHPTGPIPI